MGGAYVFDVREMVLVNDESQGAGGTATGEAVLQDELLQPGDDEAIRQFVSSGLRVLDVRVWLEDDRAEGVTTTREPLVHMTRTYWLGATQRGQEEIFRILIEGMQQGRPAGEAGN